MADMGLGELGKPEVMFKRKFRWKFIVDSPAGEIKMDYVKVAARPSLSIEETEINFLNAKMFIPGKATWETITVTYYDIGGKNVNLWSWLASVYDFTKDGDKMSSTPKGYAGQGTLTLLDGFGGDVEEWQLDNMWPSAANFGDLDYSSSEECTVELTLRYSKVRYTNMCGGSPSANCTGCS